jgi:hypothetical protein
MYHNCIIMREPRDARGGAMQSSVGGKGSATPLRALWGVIRIRAERAGGGRKTNPTRLNQTISARRSRGLQRIRKTRNGKGGGVFHDADMDAAWRAMDMDVSLFRKGDAAGARPSAEEALKHLSGCF